MKRIGLGKGLGMGYKNLVPLDKHIHSLSAKGVKTKKKSKRRKALGRTIGTIAGVVAGAQATKGTRYEGVGALVGGAIGYELGGELAGKGKKSTLAKQEKHCQRCEAFFVPRAGHCPICGLRIDAKGKAKDKKLPKETLEKLQELYGYKVPEYITIVNKNLIKIKISDWQGERWVKINPEDVIEYYDTQARNIVSGARTLAGETGDWRNIDALAKESLEIFKILNRPELSKLAKKRGMELKAKGISKAEVFYGNHHFLYDIPDVHKQVRSDATEVVTMSPSVFKKHWRKMSNDKVQIDGSVDKGELERMYAKFNDGGYADDKPYSKGKNPLATPKGQEKVRKSKTRHTSMSVGDMVKVDEDYYIVAPRGFKKVKVE